MTSLLTVVANQNTKLDKHTSDQQAIALEQTKFAEIQGQQTSLLAQVLEKVKVQETAIENLQKHTQTESENHATFRKTLGTQLEQIGIDVECLKSAVTSRDTSPAHESTSSEAMMRLIHEKLDALVKQSKATNPSPSQHVADTQEPASIKHAAELTKITEQLQHLKEISGKLEKLPEVSSSPSYYVWVVERGGD